MNEVAYSELVKLVGEERAKQFADQVDDANRTITETGMITRAEETPPAEPAVEAAPEVTSAVPPVQERQDAPPTEKPDDLATLRAQVAELIARVTKLEESYGMGMEESKRTQERATTEMAALTSRLAAVEASKERWDTWLNDAPEYVKIEADKVYRARDQEPAPMSSSEIAAATMQKINARHR